jgi:urea transporter
MLRTLPVGLALTVTLTVGAWTAGAAADSWTGHRSSTEGIGSLRADFNGDGTVDLAVGAPGENVGATVDAGAVSVFYSTFGPSPGSQVLLQNNPEAGDRFGAALAAGDFDGDGAVDLAVGAPGEDVGATVDAGAVSVFYGTPAGLPAGSQVLLQNNPEAGDRFGGALTSADFDANGEFDLAVGAPGEDVGATVDAGAVSVFYGTLAGLPAGSQVLLQNNPEAGDRFGGALTVDLDHALQSGQGLAVGAPNEDVGGTVDAGAVSIFYGTLAGLPAGSQVLLQNNPEAGDRFGAALTSADFDVSGRSDLAVGAPGENVGDTVDAGAVSIFYSAFAGMPEGSQVLLQNNPEAGDRFGAALTSWQDAMGGPDLAVGTPLEDVGGTVDAGAVSLFFGTRPAGLHADALTLLQNNPETGDRFGAASDF